MAIKEHTVDELSALFDEIEIGKNLDTEKPSDYGISSATGKLRPFADKCKDIRAVMQTIVESDSGKDDVPKTVSDSEVDQKIQTSNEDSIIFDLTNSTVDKMNNESMIIKENENSDDDFRNETNQKDLKETKEIMNDNPLELSGDDLIAFHRIQEKYPGKFILYNDSQAFRNFYRFKVRALKSILTSYPVLDIKDMDREILSIKTKYQGVDDLPDPVVIGRKMSECQLARGRVTALLMRAQMQLPAWKKCFEWLNSKLWKDHELKGAHNREGLSSDHMWDIQRYYTDLQGFVDGATLLDSFLKSTHDSLSRQLTCVIIRDKAGMAHETVRQELNNEVGVELNHVQPNGDLDGLDTIESGIVIPKVRKGSLVQKDFAGSALEEEFEDIG